MGFVGVGRSLLRRVERVHRLLLFRLFILRKLDDRFYLEDCADAMYSMLSVDDATKLTVPLAIYPSKDEPVEEVIRYI